LARRPPSQRSAIFTGELKNHKQKCLEPAPAEVLMLRQLAAATFALSHGMNRAALS
jgi:hypothetical protein